MTAAEERQLVRKISAIESSAYPAEMVQLRYARSFSDLAGYVDVDVENLLVYFDENVERSESSYILLGVHEQYIEIADMASIGKINILKAMAFIARAAGDKEIRFDAKEDTSYPIVSSLVEAGRLVVLEHEIWDWEGLTMHEMVVKRSHRFSKQKK